MANVKKARTPQGLQLRVLKLIERHPGISGTELNGIIEGTKMPEDIARIYQSLSRLSASGFIRVSGEGKGEGQSAGRPRRLYRMTRDGTAALKRARALEQEVA